MRVPIAGSTNPLLSPNFDSQLSQNLYVVDDSTGKSKTAMNKIPGYFLATTLDAGSSNFDIRLLYTVRDIQNKMFAVDGDEVYFLDSTLTPTNLGSIGTTEGFVSSASNGIYVMFVDGQDGYLYNSSNGVFNEINVTNYPSLLGFPTQPLMCAELDGFFVVLQSESNQAFVSPLNDPTGEYTNFLDTTGNSLVTGCGAVDSRVFIFKADSIEVWYDAGTSPQPLARDNSMRYDFGCSSRGSIATYKGRMAFLASTSDGSTSFMSTRGAAPTVFSTSSIEEILQGLADPFDCRAIFYEINGHEFYQANFTTDNITLTYDFTTNRWYTFKTKDSNRHVANTHSFFNEKHYLGAYNSQKIYEMNASTYDFDGEHMPCARITQNFFDETNKLIKITKIELDCRSGVGLDGLTDFAPNKNPRVYLSVSRDGGVTYGNKVGRSTGRIGDFYARPRWYQMGVARSWTFKLEFFDNVPFSMWDLLIWYEVAEV